MNTCRILFFPWGAALVVAAVGLSLASPTGALAQGFNEFNPLGRDVPLDVMEKQLRIQVEWIELAHEDLTELMEPDDFSNPHFLKSSNNGPLRGKLKELIREDKAELLETAIVLARSGQRAKSEAIYEYIYATEYDPPEIAKQVDGAGEKGKQAGEVPMTMPNATAFETRNTGTTVEVDPVLGADGRTIDLNLAPELVYAVDELVYGEYKIGESEVTMKMPVFYTVRVTTQVTLIAGEYLLVGTASPFNEDTGLPDRDRKILCFVRAEVLHTGLPLDRVPGSEQYEKSKAKTEGAKNK